MGIPQYLAMTAAEIRLCPSLPQNFAWLGCCFDGSGLTGLPETLPPDSLLILDDRVPMTGQNPEKVAALLAQAVAGLACRRLLLDFQQPENGPQKELAAILHRRLPCPMAAPPEYAPEGCALFLPPVPPEQPIEEALAPWAGQEIWLDTGPEDRVLHLGPKGCTVQKTNQGCATQSFYDGTLCCRYSIQKENSGFSFRLFRDRQCIDGLLSRAEHLGVTLALGLWQEMEALD